MDPSPIAGVPSASGATAWSAGDIAPYIEIGTYVKLREVNVNFQAPKRWAQTRPRAQHALSASGRNLVMWSKYWSFDPEFNNFGSQNFNRFIDLAPYPASASSSSASTWGTEP